MPHNGHRKYKEWKMSQIICVITEVGKCKDEKYKAQKMQAMENTRNVKCREIQWLLLQKCSVKHALQ